MVFPTLEIERCLYLGIKTNVESKRDLAIDQVPITTKQAWAKYYIFPQLLVVTLLLKKSRPISRKLGKESEVPPDSCQIPDD
jgi:hypothetical protein